MQTATILPITLGLALGLQIPAFAGEPIPVDPAPPAPSNPGNWCEYLQAVPPLYKNSENPYVQEFKLEGRLQFQLAHLEGEDVNGADYSSDFNEFRRFRLGAKGKFLQYFGAKYQVDLVDDTRIDSAPNDGLNFDYAQIDEAYLSFDLAKALGDSPFDKLELKYGRQKFVLGIEAMESSNKLLTVERSSLSNKVYGGNFGSNRTTGLTVDGEIGDWIFSGSLYSSTVDGADNQGLSGWQDGVIYLASVDYRVNQQLIVGTDYVYNGANVTDGEDSIMNYAWANSINGHYDADKWGVIGDFIYGDNGGARVGNAPGQRDTFWGVMVMPYYWIVDEKLQWVGQYEHGNASEANGFRINSRYGRARGTGGTSGINVNSGRGDNHHSFYTGLNYYLCGQNLKIQGGIEYQTLDTPVGNFDTLTYLLGFRTFF
jgi:hypothetical protein